jgi:DNA-binding transcriptional LysR family regulator
MNGYLDIGLDMTRPGLLSERIAGGLKLRELRVLLTTVETGSMCRAAEVLHTSQPAISRCIAELEQMVGVRLLERHPRGIQPTAFGRALLDCSAAVFDELRRGATRIESLADPDAGQIRIGCNPFLAASFVPATIARLHRRRPRVAFEMLVAPSSTLHRALAERSVDLLVTRAPGGLDSGSRFERLFEDPYVVAAARHHPLARRRRIALVDLVDEPWILPPPESAIGAAARAAFAAAGLQWPKAIVVAVPTETKLALLTSGRYVSILPASVLTLPATRRELKALPVKLVVDPASTGIVFDPRRTAPAADRFIDAAREVARTL